MSIVTYINKTLIPEKDVRLPEVSETLSFDSQFNIWDGGELTLQGLSKYDPKVKGSLFYSSQKLGMPVELWDNVKNRYLLRGKVQNITTTHSSGEVGINVISNISDLSNVPCTYVASHEAPSEAIYNILKANLYENDEFTGDNTTPRLKPPATIIPIEQIVYSGFQRSISYQEAHKATVNITIEDTASDNNDKTVGEVVYGLLRAGHCMMYSRFNCVYLLQYPFDSAAVATISKIISGSYSDQYGVDDAFKIINDYRIAWDDNGSIKWSEGQNKTSIKKHGKCRFLIPEEQENSSGTEDYSICFDNEDGAKWCGDTELIRKVEPILLNQFALPEDYCFLRIGDVVNLNFDPFSMQPCLIIGLNENPRGNEINFDGMLLNG